LWRAADLEETACASLARNLSPDEWRRFVAVDDPARAYQPTCAGKPIPENLEPAEDLLTQDSLTPPPAPKPHLQQRK
jgi:hypothetical protein